MIKAFLFTSFCYGLPVLFMLRMKALWGGPGLWAGLVVCVVFAYAIERMIDHHP